MTVHRTQLAMGPRPLLDSWPQVVRRLRATNRWLLLLDFDGTLVPMIDNPNGVEARPTRAAGAGPAGETSGVERLHHERTTPGGSAAAGENPGGSIAGSARLGKAWRRASARAKTPFAPGQALAGPVAPGAARHRGRG